MDNKPAQEAVTEKQGEDIRSITNVPPKSFPYLSIFFVVVILVAVVGVATYILKTSKKENQIAEVAKKEVNALTVYHWWTSTGEVSAINALIDMFSKKYPEVAIVSAPVKSAGGVDFQKVLEPMVLSNQAPDSFQGHPGYEIERYYDSQTLEIVDDVWESEQLETVIPKAIQDINKFKGNYYSIPVNVHRGNVVWYNKALLDKNGISAATLKDWTTFFKACDKLKAAGVKYPIQMGETWTAMHVFENIIASVDAKFYENWINGKVTSAEDPNMIQAFDIFRKFLSYTNPDSAKTTWNEAVNRIIKGESAFNVMGDWANGEFKIVGMKYNGGYGSFPLPGTGSEYIFTVDTFVRPKGTLHPTNSLNWLKIVASKEGQDAFNQKKGSISARSDSDLSLYDDYQKSASVDFKAAKYLLPSRGTSVPDAYLAEMDDIIADFVTNKDVTKSTKALADLTNRLQREYTVTWSFVQ